MNKRISVIITNYNRVDYVDRAIRSCIDQSVDPLTEVEIIVVDDCSDDDSLKLLEMFSESIILIKHDKNIGVAAASNSGLREASGNYIIRLDADDFFNKYALQILSNILDENEQYGFVYSDHYRVDDKGFKVEKTRLLSDELLYEHGAGVMFRSDVIKKIGFYDESLKNCEDYDFLMRIKKHYEGFHIPIPLYRYHIHGNNLSLNENRQKFKKIVRTKNEL